MHPDPFSCTPTDTAEDNPQTAHPTIRGTRGYGYKGRPLVFFNVSHTIDPSIKVSYSLAPRFLTSVHTDANIALTHQTWEYEHSKGSLR